jgi:hypothetical protein
MKSFGTKQFSTINHHRFMQISRTPKIQAITTLIIIYAKSYVVNLVGVSKSRVINNRL